MREPFEQRYNCYSEPQLVLLNSLYNEKYKTTCPPRLFRSLCSVHSLLMQQMPSIGTPSEKMGASLVTIPKGRVGGRGEYYYVSEKMDKDT
jgi:hypothetical protein